MAISPSMTTTAESNEIREQIAKREQYKRLHAISWDVPTKADYAEADSLLSLLASLGLVILDEDQSYPVYNFGDRRNQDIFALPTVTLALEQAGFRKVSPLKAEKK